ncbi:OmpA family protein [Bacteroidota bacterium]
MKRLLILTIIVLVSFLNLKAQEKPLYYIGGYAAFNYNIHWANFQKLGDIPNCCPLFESGTGYGFAAGGLFEYPIMDEVLIGARLGVSTIGALLTKAESIGLTRVIRDGQEVSVDVTTDHTIDSKIFTIGFEPYINYKFFGVLNSYLGIKLSYMLSGKIDQNEKIISPDNVTFLDGRVIQNDFYDIDIPEMNSLLFFGVFGLGYDLPVSQTIILTPEVRYNLPLNDISGEQWKASTWQFGVALKIPIFPPKVLPVMYDTLYVRDTTVIADMNIKEESVVLQDRDYDTDEIEESDVIIYRTTITEKYEKLTPKTSLLETSITAVGIKQDGTRVEQPAIIIEETEVEEGFPLLPFVFFKEGSSDLKQTAMNLMTSEEASGFNEDSLSWNTLEIYSNMLNIIGYRLKQNPVKKITIVGCNSSQGIENNNLQLSNERALVLKNYFTDVWEIKPDRVRTQRQNLPDNPGNVNDPDGIVENQRAELKITDNDIIKPVYLKDVEKTADPPVIALYPKVESEAGIDNWEIDVKQEDNLLRSFKGSDVPGEIIWQLEDEPMPEIDAPIDISLKVKDELGQTDEAKESLKLQQLTIKKKRFELKDDKKIERFFLIVFDFNSAEIKPHHKAILKDIKSRIMPNSKVTISGYADRIGDPEYNLDLAKRRCMEAQKFLKVKEENLTINPVGNQKLLYDNDLAQGRSYCRTVQVVIETPVE